ncbi:MAG: hypothetical protein KIT33_00825 [Candidatus Kapabacteria bacterium]|nr:hypothetical protein [Candidatus Kapabacteria bacterium]
MVKSNFFLLILLAVISAKAQDFGSYYSLSAGYDTNPLIENESSESAIMRNSFGIGYFPAKSGFKASYSGNITSFFAFPERNYNAHILRSDYTFQPFKYPYFEIETGLISKMRLNSVDAVLYDYIDVNPQISFVLYSDIGVVGLSYLPSNTSFINFRNLDNSLNEFELSIDKTFSTETNVLFLTKLGYKNFYNAGQELHSPLNPLGRGKNYRRFSNRQGNRQSPNFVYTDNVTSTIDFGLDIYQPITDNIIFSISGNTNIHLNDNGFYFASGTTDLYNEREFFNDIYNYEEKSISVSTIFDLSKYIDLSIAYNYFQRDFMYSLSLIDDKYNKDINRKDDGNLLYVEIKYKPEMVLNYIKSINFNLKFDYFLNKSNLDEYSFETSGIIFSTILEF